MGKIKLRIEGETKDVKAFSRFLHLIAAFVNAVSMKSESVDCPNRNNPEVRRYFYFEFDSEVLSGGEE
ncbi:hypothetical protein I8752_34335 [Nostocaceae cyanobacterium CENA369]|uniref:Uncharacterized protein n=1 Tax=Dendronalium phyllosphericum CENA369 TaxID=1725256 RepID=A0A8J7IE66_9NOST|nr:hypothetical protein [Dendronalium phyllosphericum]MBH8577953.1 hypothetical protein [Dendronalium phyllosphericum CENA369]